MRSLAARLFTLVVIAASLGAAPASASTLSVITSSGATFYRVTGTSAVNTMQFQFDAAFDAVRPLQFIDTTTGGGMNAGTGLSNCVADAIDTTGNGVTTDPTDQERIRCPDTLGIRIELDMLGGNDFLHVDHSATGGL